MDVLACPACGGALVEQTTPSHTLSGIACGARHPVARGIPRFVEYDAYVRNFSLEWTIHARTQLDDATSDESERTFVEKTGLSRQDVSGRTVLDVGCGMGRFSEVVSRWGGRVLSADLSYAVESARRNLGDRPGVQVVQADLFRLPLQPASFDIVFSLGVLHHTPSCRAAFLGLPRFVKPGGLLAVTVFARDGTPAQRLSDLYRRVTTRLPLGMLYQLSRLAGPLYYLHKTPAVGKLTRQILPISMHPRPDWRVLDTFDWYSPRYQSKHTYPEVSSWFQQAGFTDIELFEPPISVRGRREVASHAPPAVARC